MLKGGREANHEKKNSTIKLKTQKSLQIILFLKSNQTLEHVMKNLFKNYTYLIPYLSNFRYYQDYSRVGMVGVKGRKGGKPKERKI